MVSNFLISLDFEKQWGFYDLPIRLSDQAIEQIPDVVHKLIALFEQYEISSTWGVVGALACSNAEMLKEELSSIPFHYLNERCHPSGIFSELATRPYHYLAPELVDALREANLVEVASHTFSHFYTRELPFSEQAWKHDLEMSRKWLPEATTLLFPRNQYHEKAIQAAKEVGFTAFRIHPTSFLYKTSSTKLWVRGTRLIDSYFPISHHHFVERSEDTVSYSRFLRPAEKIEFLRRRKLDRIKQSMSVAAMIGHDYHLYFHPHNLTKRTQEAFNDLGELLEHFQFLKREKGMRSVTLREYLRK